ncbi:MAG: hypothetical protein WC813_00370 [Patescibacteria group bacterium]
MSTDSFNKSIKSSLSLMVAIAAMVIGPLLGAFTPIAYAAGISAISDVMTDQAPSATSNHTLSWTSTGQNLTGGTITIDFASANFSFLAAASWVTADFAFTDTNHTATAPLTVGAAPSCTATDNYMVTIDDTNETFTITFCSGWVANTAATATTFRVFGTTATGAGTISNNVDVDSSLYTITYATGNTTSGQGAIVIETNADVVVTATVNSTLTFAVSDNTIGFGPLDSADDRFATGDTNGSSTAATAHTFAVATNAVSGFAVTINGSTLTSSSAGNPTITAIGAANSASSVGTEQFGVRYTVAGGSGTVTSPYAAAGYAYDTASMSTYVGDQVASSTGPSATSTYDAIYVANITGSTEAGTYTTTINYVATGTF